MCMNSISFIIRVVLIASLFVSKKQRIVQCIWTLQIVILVLVGD